MPYGGSISQVAAGEQAMDAQTRAAYEHMLDRLVQQHAEQRRTSQADRQMQVQQNQFDRSLTSREAEELANRTERARNTDLQDQYRHDALREAERTRRENILLNRQRNNESAADRESKMLLPGAEGDADQGAWGSTDEFMASAPKALYPYASNLVARSLRARDALKQLYHADLADADVMNRDASLQHMIDTERTTSWNADRAPKVRPYMWDRSNTPDKSAIDEWTAARTELATPVATIRADRNRIGRLTPNSETGGYDAVMPSWMQRIATRPGQPKPASAAPTDQGASATYAPGTKVRQNGLLYQYDGANWNPIGQ